MPLIPLLNTKATPNLPAPVLNRERFPTKNTKALEQAVDRLGNVRQPELPADKLSAPYRALGAVGEAIAQTGGIAEALAVRSREAETKWQTAEANAQLDNAATEFQSYLAANPNLSPLEWKKEFQSRMMTTRDGILSNGQLSPVARDEISRRSEIRISGMLADIELAGTRENFQRAKRADIGNINNAISAQDFKRFESVLSEGLQSGTIHEYEAEDARIKFKQEGERLKKKAEADTIEAAQNNVANYVGGHGLPETLKAFDEGLFGKFQPKDDARLRAYARQVGDGYTADAQAALASGIASGQFTTDARIDEFAHGNAHLSPVIIATAKENLHRMDARKAALDRQQNGTFNAVRLRHALEDYDPAQDPEHKLHYQLAEAIEAGVPEGAARNDLNALLRQKFTGEVGAAAAEPETAKYINSSLKNLFDPVKGVLPWKRPEVMRYASEGGTFLGMGTKHQAGEPVLSGGKEQPLIDKKTGAVKAWQTDAKAQQKAIEMEADIRQKMRAWQDANPEKVNDLKATREQLQKLIPAGALGALYESKLQKTITPAKAVASPTLADPFGAELKKTEDARKGSARSGNIPAEVKTILTRDAEGGATRADAISGMHPDFAGRLAKMISDAPGDIHLYSGYRSKERQQELWEAALKKYGSAAEARKWVAPPGNSNHNHGTAADLKFGEGMQEWAHKNAAKYGLHFRMDHEPWHIEPL